MVEKLSKEVASNKLSKQVYLKLQQLQVCGRRKLERTSVLIVDVNVLTHKLKKKDPVKEIAA